VVSRRRGSAVRYLPFRPSSVCDSGSHDFALRSERHEGYTKNSLLSKLRRVRLWSSPKDSIRLLASQRHVPCQSLIFAQFLEGVCVQAALLPKRYCTETFKTQISQDLYAGDALSSQNWLGFKPGTEASLTLFSPAYCDLSAFSSLPSGPPVLWIHGIPTLLYRMNP